MKNMKKVVIKEVDEYVMDVKEITFTYGNLKFVYKYNSSPSFSESFLIDLNSNDKKLSDLELEKLKKLLEENHEMTDLEMGDEFELD